MSDAVPPHIVDLLTRMSEVSNGTVLIWCLQFRTKADVASYLNSETKSPRKPLDGMPLPNALDAPEPKNENKKTKSIRDYPLFTTLGLTILRVLSHDWQSAAELADLANHPNNTKFYEALRALADRGFVDGSTRHGWRLVSDVNLEDICEL